MKAPSFEAKTAPVDQDPAPKGIIVRTTAVLDVLAQNTGGLGLGEVAHQLGLNKSSLHRILVALVRAKLITQDDESPSYSLAPRILSLAHAYSSSSPLRSAALPYLIQLAERTGGCANLGILLEDAAMFVERVMPPSMNAVFGGAGRCVPLHCTATGKLLTAFAEDASLRGYFSKGLTPFTSKTCTDVEELYRQFDTIRIRGWASDDEEFRTGVFCVAVPIRDSTRKVNAAMGISLSHQTQSLDSWKGMVLVLKDAALSVSGLLGYR